MHWAAFRFIISLFKQIIKFLTPSYSLEISREMSKNTFQDIKLSVLWAFVKHTKQVFVRGVVSFTEKVQNSISSFPAFLNIYNSGKETFHHQLHFVQFVKT